MALTSSAMAAARLTILRTYADRIDPTTLPPTIRFCHTDFSLTIFDKFPKAHFHFLLLPLVRPPLRPADLRDVAALLRLPREQAKAVLHSIRRDALDVKAHVEAEMVRQYGFKWDVQMGFHAVPSMDHLHLHIMSTEFRGTHMKSKKHLNSFHPKLGFFLHLDEVLSWFDPDVEPTWFAMKSNIDKKAYEKLLKEDMTCPHCDRPYKMMSKLSDHLRILFLKEVDDHKLRAERAAAAADSGAATKRKHGDYEAGEPDIDATESRPAKRQDSRSAPAESLQECM